MLIFEILDCILLVAFVAGVWWVWKHQNEVWARINQSGGMPREASRGLVYGLILILLAGFVMVHLYWLLGR